MLNIYIYIGQKLNNIIIIIMCLYFQQGLSRGDEGTVCELQLGGVVEYEHPGIHTHPEDRRYHVWGSPGQAPGPQLSLSL